MAAIIVAISSLLTNGELSADANARQLGWDPIAMSFFFSHAMSICCRHMRESPGWSNSITLRVLYDSPSAKPRWNHFVVNVEMLSKIVRREDSSGEVARENRDK